MLIKLKFLLPLIFFILLIILFWIGLGKDPNLLPSLLVDKAVPTFSSQSLTNDEIITNDQFRGKITLLNVFATWCKVCVIEHPLLIDLAKMNDLQIYGLDYKDNQAAAMEYLSQNGNPYKNIIADPQGKLAMQFGVYGTPETFLIDKKGVVRYRYVGPITLDILEKDLIPRIKKLVKEE